MTTPVYGLTEHGEGGSAGKALANAAYRWTEARLLRDIGDNAPPGSPADGDLHVVGSSPTGDWAGQAGKLALYIVDAVTAVGTWDFTAVSEGMFFYVDDAAGSALAGKLVIYDGSAWGAAEGTGDTLPVADTTAVVKGSVDATKLVRIEADAITTGTTRVITMPDADVPLYKNNQTTTDPTTGDDDGDGYAVGSRWINTTSDAEFVCLDASTGAAVWTSTTSGAGGGLDNVVEDTTPQLGGQLDVNGQAIGDGTRELLTFTEDASAVNHVNIENQATGGGPTISAAGDDTNVALNLTGKGTGTVNALTGLDVTGNIVVSGTVDGVDVAALSTSEATAIHDATAGEIAAITSKATPVSGDYLLIEDSEDSNNKKKITIGDLPAGGGGDTLPVNDSTSLVQDPADTTKEMRIDVGGVSTGTVRVLAMADQNVSLTPNTGSFAASTHASRHQSGGADEIGLDTLGAATDVTTLNASTTAHGLLPKLSNVSTEYIDGTGTWSTPAGGGSSLPVNDTTSLVQDPADTTKEMRIDVGAVATGTVRVLTMPNADVDLTANSGTFAAATHGSRHQSGGADAIKLDDLAAPDDNTDLNASTGAHGLLPKLNNVATDFLNGQGGWTTPAGGGGSSLPVDDTTSLVQDPADTTKEMRIDVGAVATGTVRVLTMPNQDINLTPDSGSFQSPLPIADSTALVKGSGDATKELRFEIDGFTTGTTRTATWPDASITVVGTTATQTLTNKTLTSPSLTSPTVTGSGVVINTGGNPVTITEGGITRSSGSTQVFDYTNSGAGVAELRQDGVAVATVSGTQTLTNKTLATPTIASFANATHDHSNAAGGGVLEDLVWAIFFGGGPNILEFEEVTEPTTPAEGDAYLLAATPTGTNWSGEGGKIALYKGSTWYFRTPVNGTRLHVDTAATSHWGGADIIYSADETEWYPALEWWTTTAHFTGRYTVEGEAIWAKCFQGDLEDKTGSTTAQNVAHGVTLSETAQFCKVTGSIGSSSVRVYVPQNFAGTVYECRVTDAQIAMYYNGTNLSSYDYEIRLEYVPG